MSASVHTVAAYMTPKPTCVSADCPLSEARAIMVEGDIRHLPVVEGRRLVGIISDRDIAVVQGLREVDTHRFRVEDAMVPSPYSVAPQTPLREVVEEMERWHYAAVLVVEGDALVGVFTTMDALRVLGILLQAEPSTPH